MRFFSESRPASRNPGNFSSAPRHSSPVRDREFRKEPLPNPESMVLMPDGHSIDAQTFHNLRSTSHQKMNGSLKGCAHLVKQNISKMEWTVLDEWMNTYRNRYRNPDRCNDNLMAVLLDYSGGRMKMQLGPEAALRLILQEETAKIMLPRPAK